MDSKNQNISVNNTEIPATKNESTLVEYIIVLKQDVSIDNALVELKQYQAQVIRDLKKGRFLIGLDSDPGIDRLIKELAASEHIKLIQPNYSYSIQ